MRTREFGALAGLLHKATLDYLVIFRGTDYLDEGMTQIHRAEGYFRPFWPKCQHATTSVLCALLIADCKEHESIRMNK